MAQAVLLKDVDGLGEAGTAIDVSPGYLRNYLVPRKLAQPATKGALEEAQRRRERAVEAEKQAAERAGETGKLFGSVTSAEIADAIQAARSIKVDRRKIRLEDPIRETGTYMVDVEVGGG